MHEEFDGSALRELLTPAVADRGRTSAPTDAIVSAGRRRVVGRRGAVAGGALVIVAAVPLAATAIAAGPDKAAVTSAAAGSGVNGAHPGVAAPHTDAQTKAEAQTKADAQTKAEAQNKAAESAPPAKTNPASSLPTHPTLLASGTVEGVPWKVTAVTTAGNNALTAGQQCLGLRITVNGHGGQVNTDPAVVYCLPVKNPDQYLWSYQDALQYDYQGGKGTLQMGLVSSDVTKVVAHVDGLAPVTENTIPAPAFDTQAFYFLPIPKDGQGFHVVIDEYNAQGVKVGTYDNSEPNPTQH
ncbi:hypothetical protein ABH920_005306 [Catenulispora sp. EB89]|uniref:hypothetical protein n=1 Tax=Catenulispora sp. EB89 TaxID=3156257 RepID=UPI0035119396